MKSGSLCSGYGGLDLAVEDVYGATPAWVCDNDPKASMVLAARFPDVPNLGDLTTTNWATVEPVDILTAGYPCQPFSQAGQRKGHADERHIWPNIRDAISALRPGRVVLENVAGHLSLGGPAVVADLAALRYDCRWVVVRASDVGACHRRARWFCVAADADTPPRSITATDAHGGPSGRHTRTVPRTEAASGDEEPGGHGPRDGRRAPDPHADDVGREGTLTEPLRHHVRSDRSAPADTGGSGRREGTGLRSGDEGRNGRRLADHDSREALADADRGGLQRSELPLHAPARQPHIAWGSYEPGIRRHERALGRLAPSPVNAKDQLSPLFVEWMMMVPEGHVTDIITNRNAALKILGNGVVPPQSAYALRLLEHAA